MLGRFFRKPGPEFIPSTGQVRWHPEKAAMSYFILHHLRDQRMPRVVHFHPEDFKYNAILNEYIRKKGLIPPPPSETNTYTRQEGATNWVPRYFPDKDGGDIVSNNLKDELVSITLMTNAQFLNKIAEQFVEGFPAGAKVGDLRPGCVYFVKFGYVTYYNYWSNTDQSQDPPGFREFLMSEAITAQFLKTAEEIEWWLSIIAELHSRGLIQEDKTPQFAQIPVAMALDIIKILSSEPPAEQR